MPRRTLTTLFGLSLLSGLLSVTHAQALSGTLAKINDSSTITLGYRENSIPFSYLNTDLKPVGYAMDICQNVVKAVEKRLNKTIQVKYVAVTSSNRIPLVNNNTIDIECASSSNLIERQKFADFSLTHYVSAIKPMVKSGSAIHSLADLKGKRITLIAGMTSVPVTYDYNKKHHMNFTIIMAKDISDAFNGLKIGRSDAIIFDDVILAGAAANSNAPTNYTILDDSLKSEPNALLLRKDDSQFKALINDAMMADFKSGAMNELYKKWFESPIPPKNINLHLPMSQALKEDFKNPNDKGV